MAKIIVKKSELKKMIHEELLREDSINAKKRNNRNAENFIRDGRGGGLMVFNVMVLFQLKILIQHNNLQPLIKKE